MLPAPRIIAIDDEPDHLRGLADGLNKQGTACLQIHFTGDDSAIRACPYVRVIFADLHLSEGGVGQGHERDFGVIGGLIEGKIAPTGPYLVVLWTRFPDQATALKKFLDERLKDVPKPFAVVSLDKKTHLAADGKVVDIDKLVAAIAQVVRSEPHIAALLNWEDRALGAASDTVSAILEISLAPGAEDSSQRLRRLVYHLAAAGVGKQHVFDDRFQAVNEALLPILADRISALKKIPDQDAIWSAAILEGDATLELTVLEAAKLNRMSHIADGTGITGSTRGAVVALPPSMSGEKFAAAFGMSPVEAADKQFGCNSFAEGDERFKWMLIQVQATCDFAQRQPGPLPFMLALEMPEDCAKSKGVPNAVWSSPAIAFGDSIRVLHGNSRFQTNMPDAAASGLPCLYRIRSELHNALVYHLHGYGARPGHILFREEKAKAAPAPAVKPSPDAVVKN